MSEDKPHLTRREFLRRSLAVGAGAAAAAAGVSAVKHASERNPEQEPQVSGSYLVEKETFGATQLIEVDVQTGAEVRVIDQGTEGADYKGFTLSPDGERLAYIYGNENGAGEPILKIYNVKTGQLEEDHLVDEYPEKITWSADGKRIAIDGNKNINQEYKKTITLYDLETGKDTRLFIDGDPDLVHPDFHPKDPNLLLINMESGANRNVAVLDVSKPYNMILDQRPGWGGQWLADGTIASTVPDTKNDAINPLKLDIYNYTSPEVVTSFAAYNAQVSPEGTHILYFQDQIDIQKQIRDTIGHITSVGSVPTQTPVGHTDTKSTLYHYDVQQAMRNSVNIPPGIDIPDISGIWLGEEWFIMGNMDQVYKSVHISGTWNHDAPVRTVGYLPPRQTTP